MGRGIGAKEKDGKSGGGKKGRKNTERKKRVSIDSYWKRFNVSCAAVAETGDEQNRADATIYVNSLSTGC